jgi:hypothetical protein
MLYKVELVELPANTAVPDDPFPAMIELSNIRFSILAFEMLPKRPVFSKFEPMVRLDIACPSPSKLPENESTGSNVFAHPDVAAASISTPRA